MRFRALLPALLASFLGGSAFGAPFLLPTNMPGIMAYPAPPAGFDAFHASDAALAAFGLPPRPPPGGNGRLRHLWEMLVRSARIRVQPLLRPRPGTGGPFLPAGRPGLLLRGAAAIYSKNWSGLVLTNGSGGFGHGAFSGVAGTFNVPSATVPFGTCNGWVRSSLWAGLDGIQSSPDVLQAGIEADAYCQSGQSQQYYPWFEWYPADGYEITNMPVGPGNAFLSWIIANSATSGTAILVNLTTNQVVSVAVSAPGGTQLRGNSAEWIVERPDYNNVLSQLMNYATIWMSSENAVEVGSGQGGSFGAPLPGSSPEIVTMVDDSGQTISTPAPLGVNATVFQNSGSSR